MHKRLIGLALALSIVSFAPTAQALSCLPVDMYLESVVGDEQTQIFIGTATEVKNHTQVVTVSKALQGWVAPTVWVQHPWSSDWQYFCSNGPTKPGVPSVFLVTIDQYGSFAVTQTLPLDSDLAKALIADIEKEDIDAGITEATPEERAAHMRDMITELIKAIMGMLAELRYWESRS